MGIDFSGFTPEIVFKAVETAVKQGFLAPNIQITGHCFGLNSYENRVFEVGVEDDVSSFVIAKVYRPERWSVEQINEELQLLTELNTEEIPVIAPLTPVLEVDGFKVVLFPRMRGRAPEDLTPEDLYRMGSRIARIHLVGERRAFIHRPTWDPKRILSDALSSLNNVDSQNAYLNSYCEIVDQIASKFEVLQSTHPLRLFRIHGDCHLGNWMRRPGSAGAPETWFALDFDDALMGPAIQDLWLILPSRSKQELGYLLEGYESMRTFNRNELRWIEPLRTLRMVYYNGWIAKRWLDPSFPKIFPQFLDSSYWMQELEQLKHQVECFKD